MKVTTVHNTLASVVQLYTELLEEQAKENLELKNQLRSYVVDNDRMSTDLKALRAKVSHYDAEQAAKVPHADEVQS